MPTQSATVQRIMMTSVVLTPSVNIADAKRALFMILLGAHQTHDRLLFSISFSFFFLGNEAFEGVGKQGSSSG